VPGVWFACIDSTQPFPHFYIGIMQIGDPDGYLAGKVLKSISILAIK
jgi:hypothetical protein